MVLVPHPRRRTLPMLAAGLALALAACTSAAGPATGDGVNPSAPGAAASSGGQAGSGTEGVEGSLTTSGLYDATWTWEPGNDWSIGD
ncbi:MAG: hypothetical protein ACREMG_14040, partial [Gemmatimonadales bacterium]